MGADEETENSALPPKSPSNQNEEVKNASSVPKKSGFEKILVA